MFGCDLVSRPDISFAAHIHFAGRRFGATRQVLEVSQSRAVSNPANGYNVVRTLVGLVRPQFKRGTNPVGDILEKADGTMSLARGKP